MEKPIIIKKRAIDITPMNHGYWCAIEDGEPFVNVIELRKWYEDGSKIAFMLGTHNFIIAEPDEEISVVEIVPGYSQKLLENFLKEDAEKMANRPGQKEREQKEYDDKLEQENNKLKNENEQLKKKINSLLMFGP